ncbi:MAG: hydroxyacylglutathione hydrolase family protein [Fibrobacterales bacterium]
MFVKQFEMGGDKNLGYLIADEVSKKACVIDPSFSPLLVVETARKHSFSIQYILNTHGHEDHTNGNELIEQYTDIKPIAFGDNEPLTTKKIAHNTELPLGKLTIHILHTPGHTPESISIFVGDAVFTGDTLFTDRVGPTFTEDNAREEYHSIHSILMRLPPQTRVFPGHHYGELSSTTIEDELTANPFITQPDFDSFYDFKKNWGQYKKMHRIA